MDLDLVLEGHPPALWGPARQVWLHPWGASSGTAAGPYMKTSKKGVIHMGVIVAPVWPHESVALESFMLFV